MSLDLKVSPSSIYVHVPTDVGRQLDQAAVISEKAVRVQEIRGASVKRAYELSFASRFAEYTEQLDDLLHQTSRKAKLVKEHLFKLKQEGEQTMGENKDSSEARTHANMQGALTRKFVEIMGEFQEIQSNYKKHLRDRVARQVKVANPAATEAEIEKAVDEGGEGIFTDKLMSRADQTALNAYADVQSKHEELIKLESSIREVHQLFLDMAILVEQQGELLDNIEDIVSHASTYVESGVVQLEKAKDLQKKMRKKMCFLVICFGIMALILFAWLSSFVPFL